MKYPAILAILIFIISPLRLEASWLLGKITPIPEWKRTIYQEQKVSDTDRLLLHSINILECGKEDGFCLSNRHVDAWPFQINQIHWEAHIYSEWLMNRQDKEALFMFQLKWTLDRIKRFSKSLCKWTQWENYIKCQAIHHNGNNKNWFKYKYANNAVYIYKQLLSGKY